MRRIPAPGLTPWRSNSRLIAVAACAALALATAALAQIEGKVREGLEVWKTSGCADCHGVFADGNPDDDDYPIGADLRTTRLDAAGLKLTIGCGRPGDGMPAFDEAAYRTRPCYGRPLGAPPDNLQPTPRPLSAEEIDAVVAYLQARVIGRGPVTREECLAYFNDADVSRCDDYR
jgi:mono/diheme cytochrome c family protein